MPRPIRTVESNFTYLGPRAEVADLPGQREDGRFYSVWKLTDEERELIANGANIELGIYVEPIPPVSITVVNVAESATSPADGGQDHRCTVCAAFYVEERATLLGHKCGHCDGELRPVELA